MTHEATRLAEEAKQALSEALSAAESSGHPLNHSRSRDADSARDECIAAIDALAALAQPAPTAEVALPAVSDEALTEQRAACAVAHRWLIAHEWKRDREYFVKIGHCEAMGVDVVALIVAAALSARAQSAAKGDAP